MTTNCRISVVQWQQWRPLHRLSFIRGPNRRPDYRCSFTPLPSLLIIMHLIARIICDFTGWKVTTVEHNCNVTRGQTFLFLCSGSLLYQPHRLFVSDNRGLYFINQQYYQKWETKKITFSPTSMFWKSTVKITGPGRAAMSWKSSCVRVQMQCCPAAI